MLAALRQSDGQASGRLRRELFGEALDRRRFERLAGALVRGGHIIERSDSFEKEGRLIVFQRLFLSPAARHTADLDGVPVAVESEMPAHRGRGGSATSRSGTCGAEATGTKSSRSAQPAHPARQGGPAAALVETLRAWRLEEARRRRVPAFCVLSNRTIEGIATALPQNERDLLSVKGVGPKVVAQFGAALLALVREKNHYQRETPCDAAQS